MSHDKLPFEIMEIEVNKFLDHLESITDFNEYFVYKRETYIQYVEACGWTVKEFEQEYLRRIDIGWLKLCQNV